MLFHLDPIKGVGSFRQQEDCGHGSRNSRRENATAHLPNELVFSAANPNSRKPFARFCCCLAFEINILFIVTGCSITVEKIPAIYS